MLPMDGADLFICAFLVWFKLLLLINCNCSTSASVFCEARAGRREAGYAVTARAACEPDAPHARRLGARAERPIAPSHDGAEKAMHAALHLFHGSTVLYQSTRISDNWHLLTFGNARSLLK